MNRIWVLVIVVISTVAYFYFKPPSADSIAREMIVDMENMKIEYKGIIYSAAWGNKTSHTGDIRYIGRAYDKYAPFITNDAVVTTGEFSDPSIVKIPPLRHGSTYWRAEKQPKGTLIALHFIPANMAVYLNLKQIKKEQRVEFIGREEIDSKIESSEGRFIALGHNNHKFFLLEDVRKTNME